MKQALKSISFGATRVKNRSKMISALVVLVLVLGGLVAERRLSKEIKQVISNDLEKTLKANSEAMLLWLDGQKNNVQGLAARSEIRQLSSKLYEDSQALSHEEFIKSPELKDFMLRLGNYCQSSNSEDYFLITYDGKCLAAGTPFFIGRTLPIPEGIKKCWRVK